MKTLKELFYKMQRIRMVEEEIARRYPEQEMRCPVHLSIGQEAAAVGVAANLTHDDLMVSTHRGHAHYLAKGGSLVGLIGELYGKACGCSRGQGGSMHLVDRSVGFYGSTSIVGGTIPVGVGLAFAKKLKGDPGISVVCIGDAAIEEGVFHEAANFASLHKLKVLFVCENNFYSCFTNIKERQPPRPMSDIAKAHGMSYASANGNDVQMVFSSTSEAIALMHRVPGPWFLELATWRHLEHCGPSPDDHLNYRNADEVMDWRERDPLKNARCSSVELTTIAYEIAHAFELVQASPFPEQGELGKYLYANS